MGAVMDTSARYASEVLNDVSGFAGILDSDDTTVQTALDSIDTWGGALATDQVTMPTHGTPTYDTVQDWSNIAQSAGLIAEGIISDATGGNINVAAGEGIYKTTDSEIGANEFLTWVARNGIAITPNVKTTVYVDCGASPQVQITTNPSGDIDHTTKFSIGSVFYDGTTMHILNEAGTRIYNLARRTHRRARQLRDFERATGLVTSDKLTLHFGVSAGTVYAGLNPISIAGIDTTDGDTFAAWYYDGDLGVPAWVSTTGNTQLDAVQYNDVATGLANLGTNRYGVHWIYMDVDDHCNVLYGQGNYTLTQAQNAVLPASLPPLLSQFAILIARVIVQEGETEIVEIGTAFETLFAVAAPTVHSELAHLNWSDAKHVMNASLDMNSNAIELVDEIRLKPKAESTGAEGTIFYDSDDDHVYVATG